MTSNNDNQPSCCPIDIGTCDTFEFMAKVIGLPILHPGGLKATKTMIDLCKINGNSKVLDVACGKGTNACYIAEKYGCAVIGIDIDPQLIAEAQALAQKKGLTGKVSFQVADAEKLPFTSDEFDVVLFQAVLIMVANQENVLKEARRVTRPGGHIGVLELTWKSQPPPDFFAKAKNICVFFQNVKTSAGWKKIVFNSGLREVAANIYAMACPCTFQELGLVKSVQIFWKQTFQAAVRKRMKEIDQFVCRNDDYFSYGIFVGQKTDQ
jgi:ubiquinone/menaquinone biosynthesis C-methylase UbiE